MRVYVANNLVEAELVRDRLNEEGIDVEIKNEIIAGVVPAFPYLLDPLPEIWVHDARDWEHARQLVHDYEARRTQPDDAAEISCPKCAESNPANFELCWKCRADLRGSPHR